MGSKGWVRDGKLYKSSIAMTETGQEVAWMTCACRLPSGLTPQPVPAARWATTAASC